MLFKTLDCSYCREEQVQKCAALNPNWFTDHNIGMDSYYHMKQECYDQVVDWVNKNTPKTFCLITDIEDGEEAGLCASHLRIIADEMDEGFDD